MIISDIFKTCLGLVDHRIIMRCHKAADMGLRELLKYGKSTFGPVIRIRSSEYLIDEE